MVRDETVIVRDDDMTCPDVGQWAETKHNLVSYYARLFSSGMKKKWDKRIYIELYAGAGHSRIRDTSEIIMGSPLRALLLPDPFDRYIFCEQDPDSIKALEVRAREITPNADIVCIPGDCNEQVSEILKAIPVGSKENRVLSLCFVDPCDIGIKFKTIRSLSNRYVDFLVLLALYMDANRAYQHYVKPGSTKVAEFLDSPTWRAQWASAQSEGKQFPCFLALPLVSQDPVTWLSSLPQAKDYVQKRASSYDRSGANADSRTIAAGETLTLLDDAGPGLISHVRFTIASDDPHHLKALVLRMYWDGEEAPSVEAPVGDFFGLGLGTYHLYRSLPLSVGSDKALNSFFPMPFQKHARITVTNEGSRKVDAFYSISTIAPTARHCSRICFISTRSIGRPRRPRAGRINGIRMAIRWWMARKI